MNKTGQQIIAEEREAQISQKGWTPQHDDSHKNGEIARAAFCYFSHTAQSPGPNSRWPWGAGSWKPSSDPIKNLAKAGALYLAEAERLDRASLPSEDMRKSVADIAAEIDFLQELASEED